MTKTSVLCASLLILAACAKPSPLPPPVIDPVRPDPRLCAQIEPEPPVAGSIIAPVTEAEREAVRDHLTSDAEARAWGRRGWERVAIARGACPR